MKLITIAVVLSCITRSARRIAVGFFALVAFAVGGVETRSNASVILSHEDVSAFNRLERTKGTVVLSQSHGTLTIPANAQGLVDEHGLRQFDRICGCGPGTNEAVVRFHRKGILYYRYDSRAFVNDRDWGTLDPKFLLQSIRTQAHELVGTNFTTIYASTDIVGWAHSPAYDRRTHVVTFEMHVRDLGKDRFDARALILGRNGVEMILAQTVDGAELDTWLALNRGIAAFRFPPHLRYGDHHPTDATGFMPITLLLEFDSGAKLTQTPNRSILRARLTEVWIVLTLGAALLFGASALAVVFVRRSARRA